MFGARKLGYAGAALALALAACGNSTGPSAGDIYRGPEVVLGNGKAWAWVTLDASGNPSSIGVTVEGNAFDGLPAHGGEYILQFPAQASRTAFDHVSLDWNPHGHEPPGIYDAPHFDLHFYRLTMAERQAITATGADTTRVFRQPAPEAIPTGYVDAHAAVPTQGNHWIDPTSDEFQPGGTFTRTFIYGFYDGQIVFWEPMLTVGDWRHGPEGSHDLAQPTVYPESGLYYPTRYTVNRRIRLDAPAQYSVALDGLVRRINP